ncbi:MAG: EamA family transporter [Solirubrobacteraceae bacterium]
MAYLFIALTILLGVYGQLVIKWRVGQLDAFPGGMGERVRYIAGFALDPWVLTAMVGALVAAGCWVAALSRLSLSEAYPFVSASFVLVMIASAIFFGDRITVLKATGAALIVIGLVVGSRG